MLSRTNLATAFVLSLAASACSSSPGSSTKPTGPNTPPEGVTLDQSTAPRDPASPTALKAAVDANNAFAFKLYGQVLPTLPAGNVLTSPLSASLALTMTYAGAKDVTATEMAAALDLPAGGGAIFDGQNALSQALSGRAASALAYAQDNVKYSGGPAPSPSDYELTVVNSVWGQKTYSWAAPFLDVLARSYGTGVFLEDFVGSPDAAKDTINGWVSNATADKINNLLPAGSITSDTRIVLVNAVHLKLPWAEPFDAKNTASGTFTRGDGSAVTASFMHGGTEEYIETPTAQGVSLPLAGNDLSVVLLEPKTNVADLVASLTPDTWAAAMQTQFADVTLSLPKFNFTSPTFTLAKALQGLGMKAAFDPAQANFKGLCAAPPDGQNLYIGDVLQKAMMAVDENGVEAAAATAVIGLGSAAPTKQVTLNFDHPFVVAIVDSSGAIVFLGQIDDPTAGGGQ